MATDQTGAIVSRHDYRAFGEEIYAGTTGRNSAQKYSVNDNIRQQFTGYERDAESGLDYAQARYYNSAHGRFTSVDPLTASASIRNPQTFNRYSYALNSPYKFTDPLGLVAIARGAGTTAGNQHCAFDGCEFLAEERGGSSAAPQQDQEDKNKKNKKSKEDDEVIKVDTEISKDLKILKFSSKYLKKDETGQVPVGGEFSITYEYSISTPKEGEGSAVDYGKIESTASKAFSATENLERTSSESEVTGTKGTATTVRKTEVFKVLPFKDSGIGNREGTRAINYNIVVQNPSSGGGGIIREGSKSKSGKYIEVHVKPTTIRH